MDTGKATWDGCGTDQGSLTSVHGADCVNVGMYHVRHQHVYCITMALTDLSCSMTWTLRMYTCAVPEGA
jgi:hypothetical protein